MEKEIVTNSSLTKRIIVHEAIGFAMAIFVIWATEIFDLPHLLGFPATPVNIPDCIVGTCIVLPLGVYTIFETWLCLKRIKHLEGFLRVCTFCKRILVNNEWIPIEQYIQAHSETEFSHGLCSECMEKHYGMKGND